MSAKPRTILIVEDEKPIRNLLAAILKKAGYSVFVAADSKEATALWVQHSAEIGLLLSDIVMPGQSGPELARALLAERPALKIIFASGDSSQGTTDLAGLPPNTRVLQKPFSPKQLVEEIETALKNT